MSEPFVTLATYTSPIEANLARNRLEEAGVRVLLADLETVTTAWQLTNAVGGIKLQVPADEWEQARAELVAIAREHAEALIPPGDVGNELCEEDAETHLTERERNAARAWRCAVFGLLFVPLQFYVFWLLLKVFVSNEPLGDVFRRRAWWAAAINVPFMVLVCIVFRFVLMGVRVTSSGL